MARSHWQSHAVAQDDVMLRGCCVWAVLQGIRTHFERAIAAANVSQEEVVSTHSAAS